MARLNSEELAEIRDWDHGAGSEADLRFAPRAVKHRRKLLAELDWVTAEREAWKARYYRLAEALGKAREQSEALYDGDSGTISVVDERSSDGESE